MNKTTLTTSEPLSVEVLNKRISEFFTSSEILKQKHRFKPRGRRTFSKPTTVTGAKS